MDGAEATIRAIAEVAIQAANASSGSPIGLGLAIPGHIDDPRGLVRWTPNFGETKNGSYQYWVDQPVKGPLQELVGMPVSMGNDANLAALGEYRFGSGNNAAKCLVMLTLGTGIGGGVVMRPAAVQGDARGPLILVGGNQGGAELGHMVIQHGGLDCNAGTYGPLEAYCQRDAIVNRAVHRLRRGRKSVMQDSVKGDWSLVTPLMISEAAEAGDELAREIWAEVGAYLGVGIGSLVNIFAPDVFAIGGQISKAGEWLLGPARRAAENVAIPSLFADTKIVPAEQMEDAGLLGGAALALERL